MLDMYDYGLRKPKHFVENIYSTIMNDDIGANIRSMQN